jgi:hypothetical protein
VSGEGVGLGASGFASHPRSISEVRAERSGRVQDVMPRDALIRVLRDLDVGALQADHVIIAVGTTPTPGVSRTLVYQGGAFDFHGQLGLITRAATILPEQE